MLLHFLQAGLRHHCRRPPLRSLILSSAPLRPVQLYARLRHAARLLPSRPLCKGRVVALLLGPTVAVCVGGRGAYCQVEVVTRPAPLPKTSQSEPEFNWAEFWKLLRPEMAALIAAVILALGAALLNIQIPLLLGELVNVVSRYTREHAGNYLRDVRGPALKLLSLYAAQGALTSGYIVLLSRVGERVAGSMRKALFSSLLRQDMAFFDTQKTGLLVNRLTSDVQEFKSSFKQVISQGLRSSTQTLGCFVSLYYISPKLTGLLVVVMPLLVGGGAIIGSFLRRLSRNAQEQIAKATGVADEALGNVRTVRAFAMEERQVQSYSMEVDRSAQMNEVLGVGIAVFQGLSNVTLNCIVLGTIFVGGSLMAGNEMSAGDLMSFLVASQTVQRSMANMSVLFGQVVRGLSAGGRVFEFMRLRPEIPLRGGATLSQSRGELHFRDVSFRTSSGPTKPKKRTRRGKRGKRTSTVQGDVQHEESGTTTSLVVNLSSRILSKAELQYTRNILTWRRFIDDIFMLWQGPEDDLLTFHQHLNQIQSIVRRYWHVLQSDPRVSDTFKDPPIFAHKRSSNLKDKLIHADFSLPPTTNRIYGGSSAPAILILRECSDFNKQLHPYY